MDGTLPSIEVLDVTNQYVTIIVSIVHQILPCKICSKKNSEDQKSKNNPKHNGVENDKTKPFKCTEFPDASPQISIKVEHVTSKLKEDEFNESDLGTFKCDLCIGMFSSESNLMQNKNKI